MRVLAALLALTIAVPATAADESNHLAPGREQPNCRTMNSYRAGHSAAPRDGPVAPRKLGELPPGVTYMAVYRHIGDCEEPLTMVEYRRSRQQ